MSESPEVVQVRYDEATVRKAVGAFIWRRFVLQERFMWAVAAAMLVFSVWLLLRGDRSWLVAVVGTVPLLALLFVLVGWRVHLASSLARFRAIPDATAEFTFDAKGFRATSAVGEMRLPWTSVSTAWGRPDFWLFFIASNQFVTLPTPDVPIETLDRLREWLGAKVIDA